jgi:hypothetical protein
VLTWEVAAPDSREEFAVNHPVLPQRRGVSTVSASRWLARVNIAPLW